MKAEQLRQELKHKKQWDDLKAKNEAALKELEQLQVRYLSIRAIPFKSMEGEEWKKF